MNPETTLIIARQVPLDRLQPASLNRRRIDHDSAGFKELCASIKAHGVLQPIKARCMADGHTEIVYGHNRWAACRALGHTTIPCILVEGMGDDEAQAERLVENVQREDLHPLDEAEMYRDLAQFLGVNETAAKVGKDAGHVYRRLALCGLVSEGQAAYRDGLLLHSVAPLVARIPHPDVQQQALKDILAFYEQPCPLAEARRICNSSLLPLVKAPFDTATDGLAGEPPCTDCPKRTGNARDLFGDVEDDSTCTNPECHGRKCKADFERKAEVARGRGRDVLPDEQAKKLLPYAGTHLLENSGWLNLNAVCYLDKKQRSYRNILGSKALETLPVVLVQDPFSGGAVEIIRVKDVADRLEAAHVWSAEQAGRNTGNGSDADADAKAKEKAEKATRKLRRTVCRGLLTREDEWFPSTEDLLRGVALALARRVYNPDLNGRLGYGDTADLAAGILKMGGPGLFHVVSVLCVALDGDPFSGYGDATKYIVEHAGLRLSDLEAGLHGEKETKKAAPQEEKLAIEKGVAPTKGSVKSKMPKVVPKRATKSPTERKPPRKRSG